MTSIAQMPPSWRLAAHVAAAPPPPDWREELARMLGHRPRRLGEWTELALYGALRCLHEAGEARLSPGACLRLLSRGGPVSAQREALAQWREGLPMPFTFMQSQPALTLAALAQALQWQGDAAFVTQRNAQALASLPQGGTGPNGVLCGWVEVDGSGVLCSEWWRWVSALGAH